MIHKYKTFSGLAALRNLGGDLIIVDRILAHELLGMWPCLSYLASLHNCFSICEMARVIISTLRDCCKD